ncbi:MAG: hypothetical protein WD250_02790 [Egibacteraceae bacterium]
MEPTTSSVHDVDGDDGTELTAAQRLAVIDAQEQATQRQLEPDPLLMLGPWGVAWLLGFGLLFLRFGPDGRTFVDLPDWLPLATLFTGLVLAATITAVLGYRSYHGIEGPSSLQGAMYGWSWFLGFGALMPIVARMGNQLPADEEGLLWGAAAVALTGVLYMAGGAVWRDRWMFALGAWIATTNVIGAMAGPGWHSLIVAVAGGGGLLLAGVTTTVVMRRRRAR